MQQSGLPFCRVIFVCTNERAPGERICCSAGGGGALQEKLKAMVKERGLRGRIRVSRSGCMDRCEDGPNIMVFPDNAWYSNVQEADLEPLLDSIVASLDAEGKLPRHFDARQP